MPMTMMMVMFMIMVVGIMIITQTLFVILTMMNIIIGNLVTKLPMLGIRMITRMVISIISDSDVDRTGSHADINNNHVIISTANNT